MPIINSTYTAKGLFKNGHFSTIYSAKLRPVPKVVQQRERLELNDGDFIDIDWSFPIKPSSKVAILLHGLEGNAQRVYMQGQAKIFTEHGWNVAAMNHRGCSGEENRLYLSYNSGRTEDLAELIDYILEKNTYAEIALVGFSLGGNLVLKYLGERQTIPKELKTGVSISAPLHLSGSLEQLIKLENFVYNHTFINDLKGKYKRKMSHFPEQMSTTEYKKVRTLLDFDNLYTAPAHGFNDAYDYYEKSSSLQFLPSITTKVLILNALNDSFLSEKCYPIDIASNSKNIFLESPRHGGHVGFHINNKVYYSEKRTLEFINS
ncbi:alpha/beta fold hydrolase [Rasiella rasia]|uniref:Alpha/beta fold hydrolase n=1 Tax=Rasiella rasia TaxID=2744027 RepID=A0A6G6GNQ0_9FLAO|nr:alpha/beta fold hydrolase [Rasiella rasia]QIE60043.1 alpha/beta fold hydrolase [Rasiella rasia]